ncbi:hypothetical protein [Anaerotruncus colihominis]|uniref:hypothetical protein n=1 Tax=Anaerotruncus colihominis TaxID=169435 RepID=UPI0026E9C788|nr:hypothetical protein [Anaerotruncus colihominis]
MVHFKAAIAAAAFAALLILAGCAPRSADKPQPPPSDTAAPPPLSAAGGPAQQEGQAAMGLALKTPGMATLCRFVATGPDEDDYVYTPLEREAPDGMTAALLDTIVGGNDTLPAFTVLSLEQEGARAVAAVRSNLDAQTAQTERRRWLDTAARTLLESCAGIDEVSFGEDGTPVAEQGFADSYTPPPFVLPALTRKEIAALRTEISYDKLVEQTRVYEMQAFGEHGTPRDRWDIAGDEERGRALDFIADVTNLNIPTEPFDTAAKAPNRFLVRAAVLNTPPVNWGMYGDETYEGVPTYPSLEPLTGLVGDSTCFLQDHVEITAKRLFGDSVPLVHSGAGLSPWRYHEYAGVYTPPHMGTPYPDCVLLDYSASGETVEATVGYFNEFDFADSRYGEDEQTYARTRLRRYRYRLERAGESFIMTACEFLDDDVSAAARDPERIARAAVDAGLTLADWDGPGSLTGDQLYALFYAEADGMYTTLGETHVPWERIAGRFPGREAALRDSRYYSETAVNSDGSDGGAFIGTPDAYAARWCDYGELTFTGGAASLPMTVYADAQHAQAVSKGVMTFAADESGWTPVGWRMDGEE